MKVITKTAVFMPVVLPFCMLQKHGELRKTMNKDTCIGLWVAR